MAGAANYISFPQTARHWAVASSLRWAATWTACGKRPRPGEMGVPRSRGPSRRAGFQCVHL